MNIASQDTEQSKRQKVDDNANMVTPFGQGSSQKLYITPAKNAELRPMYNDITQYEGA
jgi:hypothetical protein